jgi:acetyl esterase/lipase
MVSPAINPELQRMARFLPRGPVNRRSIKVIRAIQNLTANRVSGSVERVQLGPISVRVHRPSTSGAAAGSPGPALLWIHGGGYVIGTAAQDDPLCKKYAEAAGCVVAAVDYRLAPEHPYPTPLEDCYAALTWLAAQPFVDPARIAIGGASAGGGLAAALALLVRDRGEFHPVLQLLAYPMIDDRTVLRTGIDESGFRLWTNAANRFGWQSYTGREPGSDQIDGIAAPSRNENLTGLAPAWLGVGTQDLFHDEDLAYTDRLKAAASRATYTSPLARTTPSTSQWPSPRSRATSATPRSTP